MSSKLLSRIFCERNTLKKSSQFFWPFNVTKLFVFKFFYSKHNFYLGPFCGNKPLLIKQFSDELIFIDSLCNFQCDSYIHICLKLPFKSSEISHLQVVKPCIKLSPVFQRIHHRIHTNIQFLFAVIFYSHQPYRATQINARITPPMPTQTFLFSQTHWRVFKSVAKAVLVYSLHQATANNNSCVYHYLKQS